ncbi:Crp/Fnr family transcriptional regulator, partial [Delftia acidovorans]|uniref:Crp/Fnr family transcriptional regulator n=1 Tax=Delftia acidovorans TaxID=80866 RepID=UPI0035A1213A
MRSKPAPVADPSALIRRALGLCRMLHNWPPEVLDELTALSRLGRYERHQQVRAADPKRREVLVVASGCVEVGGVDATGSRFVLSMHSAGDIVGLARLLEHTQFVYDYHAHQPTVLVEIPGESFLVLLDAHPPLWKDICLLVLARMHELIVVQQRHAFSNIDNRVAELLARLAPTHGQPAPDGQ